MEDQQIIELYWKRSEAAISETASKYGGYCAKIAENILNNHQDAEECVSDTYLAVWNRLPPQRPRIFPAFLTRLTRNLSIDRWRSRNACKRGGGEITVALEELEDCVAASNSVEAAFEAKEVVNALNQFLETQSQTERDIFLRRYFVMDSITEIAADFGFTESKVSSMLLRIRKRLQKYLEKECLI